MSQQSFGMSWVPPVRPGRDDPEPDETRAGEIVGSDDAAADAARAGADVDLSGAERDTDPTPVGRDDAAADARRAADDGRRD